MRFGSTSRDQVISRVTAFVFALGLLSIAAPGRHVSAQAVNPGLWAMSLHDGVFRSTAELVLLPVTVTDSSGAYVSNLAKEDFAIFEGRAQQPVALFSTATAPLDVLLLIDISSSMTDRMPITQQAAITVIDSLRPEDRAAVGVFNDRVQITQPLTGDKAALTRAIKSATPRGLTALYQALYVGFRELAQWRQRSEEVRRQAAIILSDGEDTSSIHVAFEDVLREARQGAVAVYTVFPGPSIPVPIISPHAHQEHAAYDLRQLADETGGRAFRPARSEELTTAYAQITEELAQQYWLGFVPPPHSVGGFKPVSVRVVTRPELRARTRLGYEASGPRTQTDASSAIGRTR